jgi:hypothetical protein
MSSVSRGVKPGAFSCGDGSGVLMRVPSLPVAAVHSLGLSLRAVSALRSVLLATRMSRPVAAGGGAVVGCGGLLEGDAVLGDVGQEHRAWPARRRC